ncbi:hypothetical protein C8J56DRAFT_985752 [Mycena floridula]|nr:hypothetical protein C8J56DRAFT_985752 [Mycena floridula]
MSLNKGSLSISGIAALENGRPDTDDGRDSSAKVYDALLYIDNDTMLLSALRYFHPQGGPKCFEEPGPYLISATITLNREGANLRLNSNTENEENYDIVGDIAWAVPLYTLDDPRIVAPYIHATGLVSNVSSTDYTFIVNTPQWTTAFRSVQTCSIFVTIPDIPRFNSKKPMPANDVYIGIEGPIKAKAIAEGEAHGIDYLCVELQNISFLGREATSAKRDNKTDDNNAEASPYKKVKFNFNSPTKNRASQRGGRPGSSSSSPQKPNNPPKSITPTTASGSNSASGSGTRGIVASGSGNQRESNEGNSQDSSDSGNTTASSSNTAPQ